MALSAALVWEVRTTGNDSNGGAFRAGASGIDYSQQDTAQIAFNDLAIDATDATKVGSAANPFPSAAVGNTIRIVGGGGFTAGRYEVVSVAAGTATLDRAAGSVGATGGVANLGGAIASIGELAVAMIGSNKAFVRSGTYTLATPALFTAPSVSVGPTVSPTSLIGYYQVRGDLGPNSPHNAYRPVLQPGAAIGNLLEFQNNGWLVENLVIQPGSASYARGIRQTATASGIVVCNVKASGFTQVGAFSGAGILAASNYTILYCEAAAGTSSAAFGLGGGNAGAVLNNYVHDNACPGIQVNATTVGACIVGNIVVNNTGPFSDGIQSQGPVSVMNNTVHNNARDGIRLTSLVWGGSAYRNNLLTNNGGYGISQANGNGFAARYAWDGNAFFGNASGMRFGLDDGDPGSGTTMNPSNAVGRYVNSNNVALAASPYVDASAGDYRLNSTAGGGAAAKGAGLPKAWPGSAVVGRIDFGAVQGQQSVSFMGF